MTGSSEDVSASYAISSGVTPRARASAPIDREGSCS